MTVIPMKFIPDPIDREYAESVCTIDRICVLAIMDILQDAIQRLKPASQRMMAAYMETDRPVEIAAMLGVTKSAVTQQLKGTKSRKPIWERIQRLMTEDELADVIMWLKLRARQTEEHNNNYQWDRMASASYLQRTQ